MRNAESIRTKSAMPALKDASMGQSLPVQPAICRLFDERVTYILLNASYSHGWRRNAPHGQDMFGEPAHRQCMMHTYGVVR